MISQSGVGGACYLRNVGSERAAADESYLHDVGMTRVGEPDWWWVGALHDAAMIPADYGGVRFSSGFSEDTPKNPDGLNRDTKLDLMHITWCVP
jgi:hypothetical protein